MKSFHRLSAVLSFAYSLHLSAQDNYDKGDSDVIIGGPNFGDIRLKYEHPNESRLSFIANDRLWRASHNLPLSTLTSYLTDDAWDGDSIEDVSLRKVKGALKSWAGQTGREWGFHTPGFEELKEHRLVHWAGELFRYERSAVVSPSTAKGGEEYLAPTTLASKPRSYNLSAGLDVRIPNPKLWAKIKKDAFMLQGQVNPEKAELIGQYTFGYREKEPRGALTLRTTLDEFRPKNLTLRAGLDYYFGSKVPWDDTKPNLAISLGMRYMPLYEQETLYHPELREPVNSQGLVFLAVVGRF